MWDWLFLSIDVNRAHEISAGVSWHGRIMVIAWGFIAPLAVMIARFCKIMPWQNWPEQLDNRLWWNSHWIGQCVVLAMTFAGVVLIWRSGGNTGHAVLHGWLGYTICALCVFQGLGGAFRGSKGGPNAPHRDGSYRGDHYDMTRWRLAFEVCHKTVGYFALLLAMVTILSGMWQINAPRWMFIGILAWWGFLSVGYCILQAKGLAFETYQAIWGPNPAHPGNQVQPRGLGVRRPSDIINKSKTGE